MPHAAACEPQWTALEAGHFKTKAAVFLLFALLVPAREQTHELHVVRGWPLSDRRLQNAPMRALLWRMHAKPRK